MKTVVPARAMAQGVATRLVKEKSLLGIEAFVVVELVWTMASPVVVEPESGAVPSNASRDPLCTKFVVKWTVVDVVGVEKVAS